MGVSFDPSTGNIGWASGGGTDKFSDLDSNKLEPTDSARKQIHLGGENTLIDIILPTGSAYAVSSDGATAAFAAESYNSVQTQGSALVGVRGRGTRSSPSGVLANDILFSFGATGISANGTNGFLLGQFGGMAVSAASDATNTTVPMSISLTTPDGDVLKTYPGRNVFIGSGSTTPTEKLGLRGRIEMEQTTAPTPTTSYGKIWVNTADDDLYYTDQTGTHYNLVDTDIADLIGDTDTNELGLSYTGAPATYRTETSSGNWTTTGSSRIFLSKYTMPANGKLTSIRVNMFLSAADTMKIKPVVYSNNAGSPDTLLAVGDEISITNTTTAYSTMTFTGDQQITFAQNDELWIGITNEDVTAQIRLGTEGVLASGVWGTNPRTYTDAIPTTAPANDYPSTGIIELTVTYNTTVPGIDVISQMSITNDLSGIKLVNDEASPGNLQYYGTDAGGTKGYFTLPTSTNGYQYQDYENTGTYIYVGYEHSDGRWYIYRRTLSTNAREYASGASGYATNWTGRAGLSYA